jgi:hypothetical protein
MASPGIGSVGTTLGAASVSTTGVTTIQGSSAVVVVAWSDNQTFSSLADTINGGASGNTWTQIGSQQSYSTALMRAYYMSAGFNGGVNHVFTLNLSGATFALILAKSILAPNLSNILTGTESVVFDAASPYTSDNVISNSDGLAVGFCNSNSNNNPATYAVSGATPTSGWTIATDAQYLDGSATWTGSIKTQALGAAGTYNAGWTSTGSTEAAAGLVIFRGPVVYNVERPALETMDEALGAFSMLDVRAWKLRLAGIG